MAPESVPALCGGGRRGCGGRLRRVVLAAREIEFDGEAFFTISPDKNCPFIIHSANNNYTVLGTSFNLQSYARENFAVVTLHTGCLQAQVRKDVIILDPFDTAIVFWIAASALSFILALFVSKKSHA